MKKCKCKRCGLEWEPRVKEPRACPRCHSYDWNKDYVREPKKK